MLQAKPQHYDVGVIASFKIMNGDELVARVESDDVDHYVLSKPMTVMPQGQGVALMQSLFSVVNDSLFTLKKSHVMLHGITADQLADHYREVTGGIKPVRRETKIALI